jgi:hypothetical protein
MEPLTDELRKTRVAIAEEVLLGIEAGTFTPRAHAYIRVSLPGVPAKSWVGCVTTPIKEVNGYPCEVCGIGSLAAAIVRKGLAGEEDTLLKALSKFFVHNTLFELEAVFMGRGFDSFLVDRQASNSGFEPWWDKHNVPDDDDLGPYESDPGYPEWREHQDKVLSGVLRAMMENIVRNNGEFVLEDLG